MESYKKNRDEEMEEMLKKLQEHQDHIVKVRTGLGASLYSYYFQV
jgi:hypothetical protein